MHRLKGILPAMVTPFDKDGEVNLRVMRDLIEWQLDQGVAGFYILGSTGEGLLLSEAERRMVAEAVVAQVRGRVPVIVHVGTPATRAACGLAAHAEEIGADAVSSIPPIYYRVGPEGVREYYRRIGAASSLPFYVYNIPGTTGVTVGVEIFSDLLREVPTLQGLKFTDYDFFTMRRIIELDEGRLNVLSGPDEMMIAAQAMGADGAIGSSENFLPDLFRRAYEAFHRGAVMEATELQGKINRVVAIFLQFPMNSAVKEILRLVGFDCGSGRPPNLPLTDAQRGKMREMLEDAGFFDFAERVRS